MAITPLPTPPTRDDPSTFSSRADAFLGALPTFATEANALATAANADAADALASAQAAEAAQLAAEAVQVFVESVSNIDVFNGATTYAFGDVVYSPTSMQSYRRRSAGQSFTDPAADPTNWAQLTALPDQTGNAGKFVTTDGTNASWGDAPGIGAVADGGTLPTNNGLYAVQSTANIPDLSASTGLIVSHKQSTITFSNGWKNTFTDTQTALDGPVITGTPHGAWSNGGMLPPLLATVTGMPSLQYRSVLASARLDADRAVVITGYMGGGGVEATVVNTTANTVGATVQLDANIPAYMSPRVFATTGGGFAVFWSTSVGPYFKCVGCTTSGNTITAGTVLQTSINAAADSSSVLSQVMQVSGGTFLFLNHYSGGTGTARLYAVTVSGTTSTIGSATNPNTSGQADRGICGIEVVNSTTAVVSYFYGNTAVPFTLAVRAMTFSGTAISLQTAAVGPTTLHTDQLSSSYCKAYAAGGPFLQTYYNTTNSRVDAVAFSVSGVNVTLGTPIALANISSNTVQYKPTFVCTYQSFMLPYSSTVMLFGCSVSSVNSLVAISVSGTTLTLGSGYTTTGLPYMAKDDAGGIYCGKDKISVAGTTISASETMAASIGSLWVATATTNNTNTKVGGTWHQQSHETWAHPISSTKLFDPNHSSTAQTTAFLRGPL